MEMLFSFFEKIKSFFSGTSNKKPRIIRPAFAEPAEYSDNFSCELELITDTATIALFDPSALPNKTKAEMDWWIFDYHKLPEVTQGKLAIIGLGADGFYKTRITNQDLTTDEQDYAKYVTSEMGVEIVSGKLFIGSGEDIPGGSKKFELELGQLNRMGHGYIKIPNGHYTLKIYGIAVDELEDIPTEECQKLAEKLPQIVIQILPGKAAIKLRNEPSLFITNGKYLFKSTVRAARKRLQPGFVLQGIVGKKRDFPPRNLILKEHFYALGIDWPEDYQIQISDEDWDKLTWKDRVGLKVVSIDRKNKIIVATVDSIDSSKVKATWYESELYLDDPDAERRKILEKR